MPGRYALTMILVLSLSSCGNDSFSGDRSLGIDFNVTDTFHVTVVGDEIVDVSNSSNDLQVYWDAEEWVRKNRPELIELSCAGFFDGGPTPGDCVRVMVRGYAESASRSSESDGSRTPA